MRFNVIQSFIVSCLMIVTLTASGIFSAAVPGENDARDNGLTVTDVLHRERAESFDLSPDGKWVVWVKTAADKKENKMISHIHLTSLIDTLTLQITRGSNEASSPQFSPDASKLAYLSSQGKSKTQIFVYNVRGGAPEKLTNVDTGIDAYTWENTTTFLFTAREDSTLRESKLKKTKDNAIVVADQEHYPPRRLFRFDMDKKTIERLTSNTGQINEFSLSPDKRWLVTRENQSVDYRYDYQIPPKYYLMEMATGGRREIFPDANDRPFDFQWAGDGKGFYFRKPRASDPTDTYVSINDLYYFDLENNSSDRVDLDWDNGMGHAYRIVKDGVVAALAGGTADPLVYITRTARGFETTRLEPPSQKPAGLQAGDRHGNRLIYAVSDASTVPEVMTAVIENRQLSDERKLLNLNASLKKKTLARSEVISWQGARKEQVEGILYYPLSYEEGKRYPLIVVLHGGPAGVDRNFFSERWSNYPHLLASKGVFVLKVNYHGSGNYGLEWMESIKGHYYEYEVPDILKGTDHLLNQGLVDREKLGIMGWSNGAILAIECCLRSDRFKALAAGAGDVNWISDYGNCAFGAAFDNAYFGGPPWEKVKTYIEKSPLFRMDKMKTPTLIMFGAEDTSVPTQQGWEHFRAMQQIGKAPVRFILFPGSGHGLRTLSQQKRKMEEELAWFDMHLFGTYEEPNEAFDDGSLLAHALKKTNAQVQAGLFGVLVDKTLVPEVVAFKDLMIGRFEVTRAQYAAFDATYTFDAGTGNHPANDITYDQARSYCTWLSQITGKTYRLPSEEEMNTLLKAVTSHVKHENNLERWAGYSPTPDEMEMLRGKIAELEKMRLLIEEVGSFAGIGKDEVVYDVGGNVAEWAVDDEGNGKIMGLSAVSTRDTRIPYTPPPMTYVGFRVRQD